MLLTAFILTALSCVVLSQESCVTPDNQTGACTPLPDCPHLFSILQRFKSCKSCVSGQEFAFLRKSTSCVFKHRIPRVCCKLTLSTTTTPPTSPTPNFPRIPLPTSVQLSSPFLPDIAECGVTPHSDRIVGGKDAELGAWPWMALLYGYDKATQISSWLCGGVIINQRYTLTAAHCVAGGIVVESVRLGEHNLQSNPDISPDGIIAPRVQDIGIGDIIIHPDYDLGNCTECNDIALIRLSRPIRFIYGAVYPICLPLSPLQDLGVTSEQLPGKQAWATGWGRIYGDRFKTDRPDILQRVQLPILNRTVCDLFKINISKKILCVGGEGKDVCRADSGGPLVVYGRLDFRRYLVGITSLGARTCAQKGVPSIFTNVLSYLPWIIENLKH